MAGQQELQVQQKREVEKAQEATRPMRAFLPNTDIFENEDALTLVLEMPGVDRTTRTGDGGRPSVGDSLHGNRLGTQSTPPHHLS